MIKKFVSLAVFITFILSTPAHALTNVFYALRDDDVPNLEDHYRVLNDIDQHHNKIDILVSQAYVLDSEGHLYKMMQPELSKKANQYNIPLMPLITNENFDAKKVDQFLNNTKAQTRAINSLTQLCKTNRYYGLQIDFEHIPEHSRNAFTTFYTNTAKALHAIHCKISVAIVPQRQEIPPSKLLLRRNLHWAAAYDQKRLGNVSDFVVLMTYNQSGGATTPAPTATIPIDREAIQFALKYIPRQKIFLGIPTTSLYWRMRPIEQALKHTSIVAHGVGISYRQVKRLQRRYHLKWQWDDYAKTHYARFHYQDFYRYVFVEDADSIAAKQALAQQYHLSGIAVFRLGNEDPKMWNVIKKYPAASHGV